MKKMFLLFFGLIIIVLNFSCSNTPYPESYYNVDLTDWYQYGVAGDIGEEVDCDIEVQNTSGSLIYGTIEVEATAFDGTKYSDELDIDIIAGYVTYTEYLTFQTGGKRVVKVEISDAEFFYK